MKEMKNFEKEHITHFVVIEQSIDAANDFAAYCNFDSINATEAMKEKITHRLNIEITKENIFVQFAHCTSNLESIANEYEQNVLREVCT